MFVVLLDYIRPLDEVDAHLEAHRAFLAEQYANGTFLASGPREPRNGGVILAQAPSQDVLLDVLSRDPFHVHGVARYDVVRFTIRAAADGLQHLIGE